MKMMRHLFAKRSIEPERPEGPERPERPDYHQLISGLQDVCQRYMDKPRFYRSKNVHYDVASATLKSLKIIEKIPNTSEKHDCAITLLAALKTHLTEQKSKELLKGVNSAMKKADITDKRVTTLLKGEGNQSLCDSIKEGLKKVAGGKAEKTLSTKLDEKIQQAKKKDLWASPKK